MARIILSLTFPLVLFAAAGLKVGSAQQTYTVTTILEKPYTMIRDPPGDTRFEGYVIDLLNEVERLIRINVSISLVPDGNYGSMRPNGEWTGMIAQLVNRKADIAAAPLTVTYMRSQVVEFTHPFMVFGPQILLKKPRRYETQVEHKMTMLLNPFSTEVWITLVFAYIAVSVSLYVISRWSPSEWRQTSPEPDVQDTFSFYNSWLYTASTLLWQGHRASPKSFPGRMLSVFWWSFVLLILAAYIASLTGGFVLSRPSVVQMDRIRTFRELVDSGIPYGTLAGGSNAASFRTSVIGLKAKMWSDMSAGRPSRFVATIDEGVERVSKVGYAFISDGPMLKYTASRQCDLYVAGEEWSKTRGMAFAVPRGSDILGSLNSAILKLQEDETLARLENKWFSGPCDQYPEANFKKDDRFKYLKAKVYLADSSFAFILLAVGILVSLLACAAEYLLNNRKTSKRVPTSEPLKDERAGTDTTV